MKKLFISIVGVMMAFSNSWAQDTEETVYTKLEDLTSKITNADFSADTPVDAIIKTYAKDLGDDGLGNGGTELFGQQAVTGWTAVNLSNNIKTEEENGMNARAAGVMSYWTEDESEAPYGLGGAGNVPHQIDGGSSRGLGVLAVWGATLQYTQEITLAAGAYMIEVPVCNTLGAGGMTNLNGFIAEGGKEYLSKNQSFAANAFGFSTDVITFILDEETKGKISLGYLSGGQGSSSSPHLFYNSVKLYKIDATPLEAERIANAKEQLYSAIQDGIQIGASTSDAQKVYDNANATYAQVLEAVKAQKELNEAATTDLSEFFIVNPHFNQDEALPAGDGITTYDYDRSKNSVNYYGMQPVKGWVANAAAASVEDNPLDKNTGVNNGRACGVVAVGSGVWLGGSQFTVPTSMSDGSKEGNLLGFLTCWSATTQYTQAVTIPAGKYTLSISFYNQGGDKEVAKNLMGFITDAGDEYLSDLKSFKVGSWEKMTVMFTLDEATSGKFSVGYQAANTGSGNMPHFFIDGISLNYVGETALDPSLFALQAAVTSGKQLLDENKFNKDLTAKFETVVSAGQALVSSASSDKAANIAAKDSITGLVDEVNASIKAYANLNDFFDNDLTDLIEKYEGNSLFAELYGKLSALGDEVETALDEYTWTTEKINEVIASIPALTKEATQKAFETVQAGGYDGDDLDITPILSGISYTYSTSAQSGANVPDKDWIYGDASNFKTQYGTAEVWNQSPFNVYRTLKDMPAGTYTITTKAFYRTSDNDANYTQYQDAKADKAYLFAGYTKTPLMNVAEIAGSDEKLSGKLTNELLVPNSQSEAYYLFNNEDYTEKLTRSVKTVLTQTGDLKFGVCADVMDGNSWVVWYSFEIAYNTMDEEALSVELAGLVEKATEVVGEEKPASNTVVSALNDAINGASDAVDKNVGLVEANNKLIAALNDYNECVEAYAELATLCDKLADAIQAYGDYAEPTVKADATTLYSAISSGLDAKSISMENAKNYCQEVNKRIGELKIPSGMDAASDDNPVECTQMIDNPSFETGDLTGWTVSSAATGDTGARENSNATYTMEGCDGNYVFNTWHGSAVDFFVAQTIAVLKPGTYELSAVVASDKGKTITVSVNGNGIDVVTENEKDTASPVSLVFAVREGESAEIKVSSTSWFKADNFTLKYFGTNSTQTPTSVEEVEPATSTVAIYSTAGVLQKNLKKGVNIVKMSNNTVKKVIVK